MSNDMFETRMAFQLNENTWVIPEGWKLVTLPNTNDMVKKIHDVCKAQECCSECPLKSSTNSFCLTFGNPEDWDIDELITKLEVAGR